MEECSFSRVKSLNPMTAMEEPMIARGRYLPDIWTIFPLIAAKGMTIRMVGRSWTPDLAEEDPSTAWK
jgi:hypothetical protein